MHKTATVPTYAHEGDAGLDLCASSVCIIAPGERGQVSTGLALAIPDGYVGLLWDKSGISHKGGLKTFGGVIDAGYRGEVLIGLYNSGTQPYTFQVGDKVAQLLIQKIERPDVLEVAVLDETARGDGAFGSTGV